MSSDNDSICGAKDEQRRRVEIYDSFRNELSIRHLSNTESYDRVIMTLSSSGLIISIAFLKDIVPLTGAIYLWLVQMAWWCFLISVLCSLVAYLVGNKAIARQLEIAEDFYVHNKSEAYNQPNGYDDVNKVLNMFTGIFFAVALFCIVIFVNINLGSGASTVSKDNPNQVVQINDSAAMLRMQKLPSSTSEESRSARIPKMQTAPGSSSSTQSNQQPSTGEKGK